MQEQVNKVGDYFGDLLVQIVSVIPKLLGAAVILLVGYFVAKALCKLIDGLLDKVNFDQRLHSGQGGNIIQKAVPQPSDLLGRIAFWVIFLFSISAAVTVLGIPLLTDLVRALYSYVPNVIAAVVIFLVAGAVSGGAAALVSRTIGDTPTGKVVATAAPVVIMSIAGFMILNQLLIAPAIVTITYAALLGSAGLGLALAFGLGGREVAGRILSDAHAKSRNTVQQVKQDAEVGASRVDAVAREQRRKR